VLTLVKRNGAATQSAVETKSRDVSLVSMAEHRKRTRADGDAGAGLNVGLGDGKPVLMEGGLYSRFMLRPLDIVNYTEREKVLVGIAVEFIWEGCAAHYQVLTEAGG